MLAAILETDDPQRLYTGLSLLVSAASDGEPVRVLLGFGALRALLDPDSFRARVRRSSSRPSASRSSGRWRRCATPPPSCFVQGLGVRAALEATSVARPRERLEGVISTSRFLREAAGARRWSYEARAGRARSRPSHGSPPPRPDLFMVKRGVPTPTRT